MHHSTMMLKRPVDGIENFDIYKNIVQLKKFKNKIFFIDGLSKL